ncbi:putative transcriptional regulator [Faecalicoccus acidiformans]|uniref:Putative transcriptional regulator n=1 Tax=Faecalicoccus acidiformans TaxID=915173 RepID=A0A7W8FYC8_9FIRM|nr:hypothetical protein [Faecalicoccus acidiformans]MBB5184630.1 putative transcriptional regulator [Faecalicoccus acidiformans]
MIPTQQLLELLKGSASLPEILQQIPDLDFPGYLQSLMELHDLKKNEIIAKTNIQRNYAYQIFDGSKHPGRDKVLQIAIAMRLDLHQTNNLLALSNNGSLYAKVKEDAILIYAIHHHYDLMKTNELLDAHGLKILD